MAPLSAFLGLFCVLTTCFMVTSGSEFCIFHNSKGQYSDFTALLNRTDWRVSDGRYGYYFHLCERTVEHCPSLANTAICRVNETNYSEYQMASIGESMHRREWNPNTDGEGEGYVLEFAPGFTCEGDPTLPYTASLYLMCNASVNESQAMGIHFENSCHLNITVQTQYACASCEPDPCANLPNSRCTGHGVCVCEEGYERNIYGDCVMRTDHCLYFSDVLNRVFDPNILALLTQYPPYEITDTQGRTVRTNICGGLRSGSEQSRETAALIFDSGVVLNAGQIASARWEEWDAALLGAAVGVRATFLGGDACPGPTIIDSHQTTIHFRCDNATLLSLDRFWSSNTCTHHLLLSSRYACALTCDPQVCGGDPNAHCLSETKCVCNDGYQRTDSLFCVPTPLPPPARKGVATVVIVLIVLGSLAVLGGVGYLLVLLRTKRRRAENPTARHYTGIQ